MSCVLIQIIIALLLLSGFAFVNYLKEKAKTDQYQQIASTPDTGNLDQFSDLFVNDGEAESIETVMIVDRSVSNEKLASDSVTTKKIAAGTILFSDISKNACRDEQIMKWSKSLSSWVCATSDTTTSSSYVPKNYLVNSGTLSFDWADGEIADALTISGGTIGSNNISGTLITTAALVIGDSGDTVAFDSSNWDISSTGAGSGFTALTVDNIQLDGNTIEATNNLGLYLYDNASNGIYIEDGGNIGIGDISPAGLLTVGSGDLFQVVSTGEIKMLESAGAAFYGTFDVGDLSANATYTFSGASGTVWHSANDGTGSGLDADTLDSHDSLYFQREITGSCVAGSSIRVINDDGTVTCEADDTGGATCPAGFTDTTYGYCIQDDEANSGTGLSWYDALDYCNDNHGARLCSSGEWYGACVNGLLTNGIEDHEWVDSWYSGSVSGTPYPIIRGNGSCTVSGNTPATSIVEFRCCKSLY